MTFEESNVEKSEKDNINPSHYVFGGIETIEYLKAKLTPEEYRGFLKGNVLKYVSREAEKNGLEDLKKDKWYLDKLIEFENDRKLSPVDSIEKIEDFKAIYAPKIKMTFEQKDELMQFLGKSDFGFENFWICLGSGANLYNEFTENELMQAWLHPELIEVSDD